jgi:hypothetical protein
MGACIARSRGFRLTNVLHLSSHRPPLVLQVPQLEAETGVETVAVVAAPLVQMVSKTGPSRASANVINEVASSHSCGLTQDFIHDASDGRRLSVRLLILLSAIGQPFQRLTHPRHLDTRTYIPKPNSRPRFYHISLLLTSLH